MDATAVWDTAASAPLEAGTVTLVEGPSFCISLPSGDMLAGHPHGFFSRDTRFVSQWRLRVDDAWPEPLAAHVDDPFTATFVLQAAPESGRADSNLVVTRHRTIDSTLRETIVVRNFGPRPASCRLRLDVECDFADLFEVKHGQVHPAAAERRTDPDGVTFEVARGRLHRSTRVTVTDGGGAVTGTAVRADDGLGYAATVAAGGVWTIEVEARSMLDGESLDRIAGDVGPSIVQVDAGERLRAWRSRLPHVTGERPDVVRLLERSCDDLAALRLTDVGAPGRTALAAGVPWFMTLFGRDSLLAAWMGLVIDRDLAEGTLLTLADLQGADVDPRTEEEPGRILHEVRFGEGARLALGGGAVYYGSADATPLFVMLLAEAARWGVDPAVVAGLLPAADRALDWIDQFGDRDGDGYVEYFRASERGLRNQGWKDSWDALHFADGSLAEPPIALCEVQGYVYAALLARHDLALATGDTEHAETLAARATALKTAFNRDFWLEDRQRFAVGLDRDKLPIDAEASNVGHCLWTGIVDDDKAPAVARALVDEPSFSGWGVRTVTTTAARYNPVSYHNGSVWPHDSAIAAAGLLRYGFAEEADRIATGMLRAARHFGDRLPELFAGFSATEYPFPVRYPTSCSPQAWAAASPLLLLRSVVGLQPDCPAGTLTFAPSPQRAFGRLSIRGVPVGDGELSFDLVDGRVEHVASTAGLTLELR